MHVCVMGAGIVGLATAYSLQVAGHDVTVVDRAAAGSGASGGNGSQLSYAYVQPLADPALWRQLPRLLLAGDSPLKLRPQFDRHQWLWGWRFLRACNRHTSRATTAALLELAAESRAAFDTMMAREKIDCDFSATGKLVIYSDAAAFDSAKTQMRLQREMGSNQTAVGADEAVGIEPALAHYKSRITGAIHTPGECAADCAKTCDGLLTVLRRGGATILLGSTVERIGLRGNLIDHIQTSRGAVKADRYVLALGAATAPWTRRMLGIDLPIYPLKGYSITAQLNDDAPTAPRVSVTDSARKVVFARMGSRLRVAGMAELGGYDTRIDRSRIDSLRQTTEHVFPGCSGLDTVQAWAGLRPATPTGIPIFGAHARGPRNLLFNAGHGALGFTLAFGSARRVVRSLENA